MVFRWRPGTIRLPVYLFSAVLLFATATSASAEIITFNLGLEFSGGDEPVGPPPWLKATFDDGGAAGSVKVTLSAPGLTASEFATEWDFNLDPALDPDDLVFTFDSKIGTFEDPVISTGVDAFMADGDGLYDIEFLFENAPPADRFGGGDSISYIISGIASLTASSFNFLSAPAGGHGPFVTAAHIQGIGANADGSGWITVPEPSSIMLAVMGAVFAVGSAARARRKEKIVRSEA